MPSAQPKSSQPLTLIRTRSPADQLLSMVERVAAVGTWTLDIPTGRLQVSQPLAELLGWSAQGPVDVSLHQLLDCYVPESRAAISDAFEACLQAAQSFDLQAQIVTSQGQYLWVRTVGGAIEEGPLAETRAHGLMQDLTALKQAEQESLSITMRLATTLESITEAFVTLGRDGSFIYVNRESERLLSRDSSQLLGRKIWAVLDAGENGPFHEEIRAVLSSGLNREFEAFFEPTGKWLKVRAYPFEEGIAVYFRDVTAERQSQEQLLLLQTSISRLNDIVLITEAGPVEGPGPRIVFVNHAFERHTGYQKEEVLQKTLGILLGPLTERAELGRIRRALIQSHPVRAELTIYCKSGQRLCMELEIVPVDYFSSGVTHWIVVARDITERKANEDEIEHLAFYDALTQLPNRQLLMGRLRRVLTHTGGKPQIGALMFIDLDHFKLLNDSLGHSKGDLLLRKVASRLSISVEESDTVARLGGDEFVVMLKDLGDSLTAASAQARQTGEKILAALGEPYELAGYPYHGTCSLGITCFDQRGASIEDLLKQADLAMYQAKASGRNALCFFDPVMQAAATANAALTAELRQSLRTDEFLLHYQPQVGRDGMLGVEALVRWQHPHRGVVYPNQFITQAEESGLILPLGKWVLETACAQLARWAKHPETEKLTVAINVSVRQFRQPDFVELVLGAIQRHGVRPHRLKLELTESLLATGMEVTVAKMGMLKTAGITLSIDDFGMGYSALSYLKHLPLDQLKIDRAFVKDILTDPNDAAIARTIVGLAQSLGLGVIAEGVETEAQRELLARFGCEGYQGHLFCEALPIAELELFMRGLTP